MQLSIFAVSVALLSASPVYGEVTADEITTDITKITTQSSDLTHSLSLVQADSVVTTVTSLVSGFDSITTTISHYTSALRLKTRENGSTPYKDAEQKAICKAFGEFTDAHGALLSSMVGQHDALSKAELNALITAALQETEASVDSMASAIIEDVPVCAGGAKSNKNTLDEYFDKVITAFSA